MENTVLSLAYRSKEIHNINWTSACTSTFTRPIKDCIALFKSVFVYSILFEDTLSRRLDQL